MNANERYEYHYTVYGTAPYGNGIDILLSVHDREALARLSGDARGKSTGGEIRLNLRALAIVSVSEYEVVAASELTAVSDSNGLGWFEVAVEGKLLRTGKQLEFRQVPLVW